MLVEFRYQEEIAKCYQDICHQNEAASKRKCEELLKTLYQPMEEAFKSGAFACPGGYGQYKGAVEDLVAKYRATPQKGVMVKFYNVYFIPFPSDRDMFPVLNHSG